MKIENIIKAEQEYTKYSEASRKLQLLDEYTQNNETIINISIENRVSNAPMMRNLQPPINIVLEYPRELVLQQFIKDHFQTMIDEAKTKLKSYGVEL